MQIRKNKNLLTNLTKEMQIRQY